MDANWLACDDSGTPLWAGMTDPDGFVYMSGTLSGNVSGAQSDPNYGFLYGSETLPCYPGAGAQSQPYDPLADDPLPGLGLEARNGVSYDDNGTPASVTSSVNGTVNVSLHACFLWQPVWQGGGSPASPPPPAPATATFLLQTQLWTYCYGGYYCGYQPLGLLLPLSGLSAQASANDVFGEQTELTLASPSSLDWNGSGYWVHGSTSAGGSHLVTAGVSGGGIYTITLSGTTQGGSVDVLDGSRYHGMAVAYAAVNGGVKHDDRAVTISADVDPTLAKGPRYNADDSVAFDMYGDQLFTPHPHAPTADGTMYGDIGLDDSDGIPLNSMDIVYSGNRMGNWHIDQDTDLWFHTLLDTIFAPDHQGETLTYLSPDISDLDVHYNGDTIQGLPGGVTDNGNRVTIGTDHVHLTYTDGGDGAVATANYYMQVHHAWEWIPSNKPADGFWREVALTVAHPGYAGNNGNVPCTWSEDNPFIAEASFSGTDIVAGAFTVAGAATPYPGLNALLTLIGFAADKFGPKPDNGNADFNGCWNSRWSTFSTDPPPSYTTMTLQDQNTFRSRYTMVPHLFLHYTINYYLADHWGPNGYIAQVPLAVETLDMRPDGLGPAGVDWCGAFQLNNDTKIPPPPTHGN